MTETYLYENNAIVTVCCGKTLNNNFDYPSHYLCNIAILAKAFKVPTIKAYLYNIL